MVYLTSGVYTYITVFIKTTWIASCPLALRWPGKGCDRCFMQFTTWTLWAVYWAANHLVHLPGGGPPQKGLIGNSPGRGGLPEFFPNFYLKFRVLKLRFLAFPGGPGGFREVREAGRNHFHLSWYLLVSGITSYGQKPWGKLCLSSTVWNDKISLKMKAFLYFLVWVKEFLLQIWILGARIILPAGKVWGLRIW